MAGLRCPHLLFAGADALADLVLRSHVAGIDNGGRVGHTSEPGEKSHAERCDHHRSANTGRCRRAPLERVCTSARKAAATQLVEASTKG